MNKNKLQGIIIGLILGAVLFHGGVLAKSTEELLKVTYNNMKIYINGSLIEPTDANKKPVEPFLYDGTTYLPVRAISEALGKNVYWNGDSASVYIEDKIPEGNRFAFSVQLPEDTEIAVTNLKSLIRIRLDSLGYEEATFILSQDKTELVVTIPSMKNHTKDELVQAITTPASIEFRDPDGVVLVDGSDVASVKVVYQKSFDEWVINLTFTKSGAEKFRIATKRLLNQKIGIYINKILIVNPKVESAIDDGKVIITGMTSQKEAENAATLIRSAVNPTTITLK